MFLVFKQVTKVALMKLSGSFVFFLFIFSWLGSLRNVDGENDLREVFRVSSSYPEWIPIDFMWIYMYITSSINNIENVILTYPDVNFEPYSAFFGLIPSFIRNMLEQPVTVDLVVDSFNVSSFMPNYLSAFGVYGSLVFYFFGALVSMYVFYKYIETRRLEYGFTLVILLHSISLSVFSDFFVVQVYVFQIVLQFFVFRKIMFKAG